MRFRNTKEEDRRPPSQYASQNWGVKFGRKNERGAAGGKGDSGSVDEARYQGGITMGSRYPKTEDDGGVVGLHRKTEGINRTGTLKKPPSL